MKEKILQTALDHSQRYGIRKMSMQKLVASLNMSTKTFYKYFCNKEELVENVLHLYYRQQYQVLEKQNKSINSIQLFYNIWHNAVVHEYNVSNKFFQDLQYYYPALEQKITIDFGIKFWEKIKPIVNNGIKEGFFIESINTELVLESISILVYRIGRSDQFQKINTSQKEIFRNSVETIIRGMCTNEGLLELEKHIKVVNQKQDKTEKENN